MNQKLNYSGLFKVLFSIVFILSVLNGYTGNKVKTLCKLDIQERKAESFDAIKLSSCVDVFISQGNNESIKVEADGNVISKIITEVRNSVLNIYTEDLNRSTGKMAVYVTVKELKSLKISGSGDVRSENTINTNDFRFLLTGSGDLSLDLKAKNVDGEITGSGDVKLSGILGVLKVQISGSGDLYAGDLVLDECNVSLSGSGDVRLIGVCKNLNISGSSSGDISASKLETEECRIFKTGSGDVSVWVNKNLYIKSSGSGDVYYKGDPNINSNISGSGDIRKL